MTPDDWERVLSEASALGTRMVCFIGGEPTLNPALPRLVRHALSLGMGAEVYSNLVHLTPPLWNLFETPGVHLATSWYSSERLEHRQITGRDTHRQTLANIEEAVRREIPLRVGLIDGILPGQHAEDGAELLRARGVTDIGTDHLREFGRGTSPHPSQACGNCGHHRAAVLPDGTVTPCPMTRWMEAGSVHDTALSDIMASVTEKAAMLPARLPDCAPFDDCKPGAQEPCDPNIQSIQGSRECRPDVYCAPLCTPNPPCKPSI
jgi:MoaA/NifB/PqqE/SkfB family radical SAM enzyme